VGDSGPVDSASLKAFAESLGFATVGVAPAIPPPHFAAYEDWLAAGRHASMDYLSRHAELRSDPKLLLPTVHSVVAVTLNYNQPNDPAEDEPRIAKYALGRDYHRVMRAKLDRLADWIRSEFPGADCRACVDSAPILEREFGWLAGLGWFGKNTMLIDTRRGSCFFIGLVLTSAEFEPDQPAVGGCGSCNACIEACPTGAIVFADGRWQIDARRCISYLTIEHDGPIDPILAEKMEDWTFGCDVCQDVCPFNFPRNSQPLRAAQTTERDFLKRRPWPTLVELAVIGQDEWDRVSPGSPMRRAGLEGIRRNAAITLQNRQKRRLEPED
jgi:epoxyqueuosine reductase